MALRILVLFAHPALERSRVHARLLQAPQEVDVHVRDLYEMYPDLDIDVEAEQAALLEHDVVIVQHPLYWYSAPPIIKQWQDLVLQHGWAYGSEGHALEDKLTFHVISAGGQAEAYTRQGTNHYSVPELLRPFEATANLCGMRWLPPYVLHGTLAMEEAAITQHVRDYRALLEAVRDERLDLDRAAQVSDLGEALTSGLTTSKEMA